MKALMVVTHPLKRTTATRKAMINTVTLVIVSRIRCHWMTHHHKTTAAGEQARRNLDKASQVHPRSKYKLTISRMILNLIHNETVSNKICKRKRKPKR